jgi:hypothetical protein
VLITNEFHEFCWFTILGTSDDRKPSYGPKSIISSLCPKPRVVTNNMTRVDNVTQSPGPAEPQWGQPAPPPWSAGQGLASFQNPPSARVNLSQQEGHQMWERWCCHKAWPLGQVKWSAGLISGPLEPKLGPRHQLNPPINTLLLLPAKSVKKVRFGPL